MERVVDLAIIGGGINGTGLARDAAGRGLAVYLCEQDDLASHTSSWSTKLIHGGLRYLEYYAFRLVREALIERETLWTMAPHLIGPLRFVLPLHRGLRPAWLLRLGLFLYDHLGGRKLLPSTRVIDLATHVAGQPLKPGLFRKGFEYSDCRVDDSRLVVANALDAAERGAMIETRSRAVSAVRESDGWILTVKSDDFRGERRVRAKVLVNAAGPWVAEVLQGTLGLNGRAKTRLVQGSHIVVRKLYAHDRCYIFQNSDGRIVFTIPYEGEFTLIGTTDHDYSGDPAAVRATEEEINYLLALANAQFSPQLTRNDVVWSFSGVRPLYDDGATEAKAATRDYVLDLDQPPGKAALLSIYGGKITTYRRLAEEAMGRIAAGFPRMGEDWTHGAALPGGDFPDRDRRALKRILLGDYPFVPEAEMERMVRLYGTRTRRVLGSAASLDDLGVDLGSGLRLSELRYLVREEWARTPEDVLWRRTKLGLHGGEALAGAVAAALPALLEAEGLA